MTLHKMRRMPLGNLAHKTSGAVAVSAPPMTVRIGCRLVYQTVQSTPIFLVVRPRTDNTDQIILEESLTFPSEQASEQFLDAYGNITHRWTLPPGQTVVVHDALVQVSSRPDDHDFKKFSVPIQDITPETNRFIAPMMLGPFIENAFKHGTNSMESCYVHIRIAVQGDWLEMQIRNSIPKSLDASQVSTGIGLQNAQQRLQILYPGKKHRLNISTTGTEYSVNLALHLNPKESNDGDVYLSDCG